MEREPPACITSRPCHWTRRPRRNSAQRWRKSAGALPRVASLAARSTLARACESRCAPEGMALQHCLPGARQHNLSVAASLSQVPWCTAPMLRREDVCMTPSMALLATGAARRHWRSMSHAPTPTVATASACPCLFGEPLCADVAPCVLFVLAATGCCSRTISSLLQAHRLPHQHAGPRTTKCTRCCPRNPVLIAPVTCAVPSACATAMARTFRLQRTAVDGGVLHAVAPVDLAV